MINVASSLLHPIPPFSPLQPLTPDHIGQAWQWSSGIGVGLMLIALWYSWGVGQVWQRAGWGRGVRLPRVAYFVGGLLVLITALLSPLDALSDVLFAAHMVQHLLLLLLAPLCFVLSRPLVALLWALPRRGRLWVGHWFPRSQWLHSTWRFFTFAPVAWLLHTVVLWSWHTPALYQAALRHEILHAVEHLSFLGAAWLLWWTVLYPVGGQRRYGVSVLAIFLTALQGGILGALLTFSSALWYPVYAPLTATWGLTPLADQQLAGVIMWVPSGIVYLLAAAGLFTAWLAAVEQGMRRREGRRRTPVAFATKAPEQGMLP